MDGLEDIDVVGDMLSGDGDLLDDLPFNRSRGKRRRGANSTRYAGKSRRSLGPRIHNTLQLNTDFMSRLPQTSDDAQQMLLLLSTFFGQRQIASSLQDVLRDKLPILFPKDLETSSE